MMTKNVKEMPVLPLDAVKIIPYKQGIKTKKVRETLVEVYENDLLVGFVKRVSREGRHRFEVYVLSDDGVMKLLGSKLSASMDGGVTKIRNYRSRITYTKPMIIPRYLHRSHSFGLTRDECLFLIVANSVPPKGVPLSVCGVFIDAKDNNKPKIRAIPPYIYNYMSAPVQSSEDDDEQDKERIEEDKKRIHKLAQAVWGDDWMFFSGNINWKKMAAMIAEGE